MITIELSDDGKTSRVFVNGTEVTDVDRQALPGGLELIGTIELWSRTPNGPIAFACRPCGPRICCGRCD